MGLSAENAPKFSFCDGSFGRQTKFRVEWNFKPFLCTILEVQKKEDGGQSSWGLKLKRAKTILNVQGKKPFKKALSVLNSNNTDITLTSKSRFTSKRYIKVQKYNFYYTKNFNVQIFATQRKQKQILGTTNIKPITKQKP